MEENSSYEDFASEEFIHNPSEFSKHTLKIAKKTADKNKYLLEQKTFIEKIKKGVKLRLLYQNNYIETTTFLDNFKVEKDTIENLYNKFEKLAEHISINNILLAYSMMVEKDNTSNIITKEDEKLLSMEKLKLGKISRDEFNKEFGHHSLNPFEVSSEKFHEYSDKKLKMMIENIPEPRIEGKVKLKDYLKQKQKKLFPIYNALREELRNQGIKIIAEIRKNLLELQKEHKIEDIFSKKYEDVIKYE